MLWIFLTLIATFLWACVNILDKVLRTKYLKDSVTLTAAFGIYSILFSFILFLFTGVHYIPFWNLVAAFVAGLIITPVIILYIKALSIEEASRVDCTPKYAQIDNEYKQ